MATLGDMKTRVADELKRIDSSVEIGRAIASSIQHFKEEMFVETERTREIQCVEDQREYSLPDDFSRDVVWNINYDGTIQPLERKPISYLDALDTDDSSPETGIPTVVAIWGAAETPDLMFHLWPRPQSSTYVVQLRYISNLAAPADDTEENNFWMNEAEQLIRCYAKKLIFADVLRQYDKASEEEKLAIAEYNRLTARTEGRYLRGTVQGYI